MKEQICWIDYRWLLYFHYRHFCMGMYEITQRHLGGSFTYWKVLFLFTTPLSPSLLYIYKSTIIILYLLLLQLLPVTLGEPSLAHSYVGIMRTCTCTCIFL